MEHQRLEPGDLQGTRRRKASKSEVKIENG
jgi:hypothetical protein